MPRPRFQTPTEVPFLLRYGGALLVSALALLLTWLFWPLMEQNIFLFFFVAVVLSAWYGGLGPSLFATVFAVLVAGYFFIPPFSSLNIDLDDILRLGAFAVVSFLISSLTAARRRAETAARQQHQQLQVTLSSIGDAVISTDVLGRVTFMNPVAESLTGWTTAEARDQDLTAVFHIVNEETRRTVENPLARVIREGVVVGLANHTLLITKDGTERAIDDSGAPIRSPTGEISGAVLVFRDITEQRRADLARMQLAAIVESSDDAIIGKNLDGVVLSWNLGAERIYGYSPAEMIGQPIARLIPPERPDELPQIMERLKRGERVAPYETVRMRKDGTRIYVSLTVSPIKDTAGRITGASAIARDITERKRAEQEHAQLLVREQAARAQAEEAQRRFAFLAEASSVLGSSLDYQATLASVTRLAVPYLADWCAVDILADDGSTQRLAVAHVDPAKVAWAYELQRRYPPDPHAPYGVAHVLRSGQTQFVPEISDAMLVRAARDDEQLAILREVGLSSSIIVPLAARGRVLGALSFVSAESGRRFTPVDLVLAEELARRAALAVDNARLYAGEHQARQSAERAAERTAHLQAVTAALSEALTPTQVAEVIVREGLATFGADAGSVYILVDEGKTFELLGYAGYPQELAPQHTRASAETPSPLQEAVQSRALVVVESPQEMIARWPRLAAAQAQSGDATTAAAPLLLDQRVLGVLYVAFRTQRQFSPEDRAFLTTLARQCAQALERARLYEAERRARAEAEKAVRMRDVFLSIASHELKTPLTSLFGNAQLMERRATRESTLNERDRRTMRIIVEQATRLNKMIAALLDVSRIEMGQLMIERAPLDLGVLVRQVVDEVRPSLDQHTVMYDGPIAPLLVSGDALRLEQVLQNLIGNAIKYSPAGGPVRVQVERHGAVACVAISDQGIGVPREALSQLFQRFYRATNADERHISGMGVGLYVVKEIVNLHGGTVQVESVEGQGSTFTVCLPLLDHTMIARDAQRASAKETGDTPPAQVDSIDTST